MYRLSRTLASPLRLSCSAVLQVTCTHLQPALLIGRSFVSMNIPATSNEITYIASLHMSASEETLRKREKDIHSLLTKPLPQASNVKPSPSYYMAGVGTGRIVSIDKISNHKCIFIKGFLDMKRLEAIRKLDCIDSCEKQVDGMEKGSEDMSSNSHNLFK